jgi:hemerythrin superfamily protein
MNIYEALQTDHEKVRGLLNELIALDEDNDRRSFLIEQIRDELIPHSRAEEAVLYNSLRMLDSSKGIAMHGYAEHMEAEGLLRGLQAMDKFDTAWKTTAIKLKEALEHHIQDEESRIFSAARQTFTEEEAEAMAQTFEAMKPDIREEGLMKTTLDIVANLMPPRLSHRFRMFDITQRG